MRYLEPIVASVCFALLLLAGVLALEANKGVFGPSAGAAVAVAALAAFFVVYDMMKRDGASRGAGERNGGAAKADVSPRVPVSELEIIDAVGFEKSPAQSMLAAIDGVDKTTPIAFRIAFPAPGSNKPNPYDGEHLLEQLKVLEQHFNDQFRHVYFVRHNKHYLAFAPLSDFVRILTERDSRRALIGALNAGREDVFLAERGIDDTVIESTLSNVKALQQLAQRNKVQGMIVKPTNHRAIGIIDWATLVTRVTGPNGP